MSYKSLLIIFCFLLIGVIVLAKFVLPKNKASATWWNDSWHYRQAINISSHNTNESNVYIIASINIGTTNKAQTDDGDFRFISQSGDLLSYYISSGVGTTNITFHILIPSFASGASTIYAYYGNPSAPNGFSSADFATQASNYTIGSYSAEEIGGGPIAYWKFDEGVGTTAYDSSISHHSTLSSGSSTPIWQTEENCISNKCIFTQGQSTSYIDTNYDFDLDYNSSSSISFWFKPTTIDTGSKVKNIIAKNNYQFIIAQENQLIRFIQWQSSGSNALSFYTSNFIQANTWYHLEFIYDSSQHKGFIYINGKLNGSANTISSDFINRSESLKIGTGYQYGGSTSPHFYGLIDEVKIYSYARTADQIKQDYNSRGSSKGSSVNLGVKSNTAPGIKDSLIAYYKFDEGSGTIAYNSGIGGTTINGTFSTGNSAPTWTNEGKFNKALSFNTNQYIYSNSTINNVQAISYWIKANSIDENIMNLGNNAYIRSNGFLSGLVNINATTYIDGIKETLSSEMVTNGNMETGNPPTSWNPSGGCWATGTNDERTGGSGIQSINIGSTYNTWVAPIPVSTLTGGKLYRISSWLKAVPSYNSTTGVIIANSSYQTVTSSSYTGTTWQKSILHFVAPSSTFSYLTLSGNTPRYGQYDDVSIKEITSIISANNWHHIVIVLDSPINITNLAIGKVGNTFFNGLLDEVKFYNSALTADEIKQDYNAGSATKFGSTTQTIGGTTTSLEYCIPGDTSFCATPVAEWKMDEGVGTSIIDTSGNNNTGTLYNSPLWVQGKIGQALNFDGTDDFIQITNSISLQQTGNYTLETWFKPINNTAVFFILKNGEYGFKWNGSTSALQYYDEGYKNSSKTSWNLNQWYHLSMVKIGSTASLYINGILDSSASSTTAHNTGYNLELGRYGSYFNGSLDNIKIYNYARTPAQIAYDYNKGAPVGWWKFDECQGNIVYDWSGIGNTGSINIGPSGNQTSLGTCQVGTSAAWTNGASGHTNGSIKLDGQDDYVTSSTVVNGSDATISFWVKNPASVTGPYLLRSDAGVRTYIIVSGNNIGFTKGYPTAVGIGSKSVNINDWNHIVLKWWTNNNTSYGRAYINGQPINIGSSFTDTTNGSFITVGGFSTNGTQNASGQFDDVRVYNYTLTDEQIKQLYNGGAVSFN